MSVFFSNKYTDLLYGGNRFQISIKIFPEIFYEYVTCRIDPPFPLSKCHIWGGYGGGEGVVFRRGPPCQIPRRGKVGIKYNVSFIS